MPMNRREFLATTAVAGAGLLVAARASAATDSRVDILLNEPIGRIAPEIHGHFAEHLGGVVYDGIWVGERLEDCRTTAASARALVDHAQAIKAPVIRWPGGCFADSYDWQDGIGPRAIAADAHELLDVDRQGVPTGRRSANRTRSARTSSSASASSPARSPTSPPTSAASRRSTSSTGSRTATRRRAAPPSRSGGGGEPFNVRYWGVGNESWGCGGNFTPEEYCDRVPPLHRLGAGLRRAARIHRRRSEQRRRRVDARVLRRARPAGQEPDQPLHGWALHHYSWNVSQGRTTDWNAGKGDALKFPPEEWYELLREADRMEALITNHWAADGRARSRAQGEARRRRVGRLVQAGHRAGADPPARAADRRCVTRCSPA